MDWCFMVTGVPSFQRIAFTGSAKNLVLTSRWGIPACVDNAVGESLWSTFKTEFYDHRTRKTRDQARRAVGH